MKRRKAPDEPRALAEAVCADPDLWWFPIRHYSPRAASLVDAWIRETRPAAVLVEAPDDVDGLLGDLLHAEARLPLAFVSAFEDRRNRFGLNGVCSPDAATPARFRSWFPLVEGSPEVAAWRAGAAVGARLGAIDAPLTALVPYEFGAARPMTRAPDDGVLGAGRWTAAVCRATGCPDFESFWHRSFEAPSRDVAAWRRDVTVFAWCVRQAEDPARLEADGTLVREAHMRARIDAVRKEVDGPIVVVAGALHVVALPFARGRRARGVTDAGARSVLGPMSHRGLVRLYDMEPRPAWPARASAALGRGASLWEAVDEVAVEIVRAARTRGAPASTADAVAAGVAARRLAALRSRGDPTVLDVVDAVRMALTRAEGAPALAVVDAAIDDVLVGSATGRLPPEAPVPPLLRDFQQRTASFRLPRDGAPCAVRCEIGRRPEHRERSAFLHRCRRLGLPVFHALADAGGRSFRGPDPGTGADAHLLAETWGWCVGEDVDAALLELCSRGDTVEAVAVDLNRDDALAGRGDPAALASALLDAARMRLGGRLGDLLDALRRAALEESDARRLVAALDRLVRLHDGAFTLDLIDDGRLAGVVRALHGRAVRRLPSLGHADLADVDGAVGAVAAVARWSLGFPGLDADRDVLVRVLEAMVADERSRAAVRGVTLGALYGFGVASELRVVESVDTLLRGAVPADAGPFLEGLFVASRGLLLLGDALLAGLDDALGRLDDEAFHRLLPDLRRAFTSFTPAEIAAIGSRLGSIADVLPTPTQLPNLAVHDGRARDVLARWGL